MAYLSLSQHKLQSPCNLKTAGGLFLLVLLTVCGPACSLPQLYTYRPDDGGNTDGGRFVIPSGSQVQITIFGNGLNNDTVVKFTRNAETCSFAEVDLLGGGPVTLLDQSGQEQNSTVPVQRASLIVDLALSEKTALYFCLFENEDGVQGLPVHQGADPWLAIVIQPSLLPLWVEIIFIIVLMILSGLFSGLNLGLMSLDPTTLKIITESGSKRQRLYARLIYKVRKHGNYLLCTLLLGNVLVNSTLTILLDTVLPSGIYAVVASTLAIVIFGEIIPQAICSRHGLVVGAWTLPLTLVFMVLTFPLSLPLSFILNLVLGKEIGSVYNRDQLLKLLHVTKDHHDLENDEVDIISGVLGYKKKLAKDVMTKFDDIFCIDINSVLDFKTMKAIYESGFSRIPVYEYNKENIVHLLYVRDLAFVDPDDKTTLASHIQFYQHQMLFFFEDTPLDDILKGFLDGKCHLGVIQTVREEQDKDPVYVAVGVITLEDIIEEILQREIVDETDRFVDNRTFEPCKSAKLVDVNDIVSSPTNCLTFQQRLAVYQFLCTEVEPFKGEHMSGAVLQKLLTQHNIVSNITHDEYREKNKTIYSMGSSANYFCLVLEGCVEVVIGRDGMRFETRSFSYFGAQALEVSVEFNPPDYKPDFTVRPVTDCVVITITRAQYAAAHRASVFEGGKNNPPGAGPPGQGGGGSGSGPPGQGGGRSGAALDDSFEDEWTKAEAVSFGEPQQRPSKMSAFSQFGLFLTQRRDQKKRASTSDQSRLLSLSGSTEAGSPVDKANGDLSSPVEVRVSMEEPIQDYNTTPIMLHRRLQEVGQSTPAPETNQTDIEYQQSTV